MRENRLRLAVLISGGGTTLRNVLEKIEQGQLSAEVTLVISSNPQAGGLRFAGAADVPTRVIERRASSSDEEFGQAIFDACRAWRVDVVVMAGFLKYTPIPADFENRVVNIHPSLIPAFCGHGFYGMRVHEAVLEYGAKVSGCTVHFVDNQYDHGPIILQRSAPVLDDDTPETLARRIFALECEALPQALALIAAGRVKVVGRRVVIAVERLEARG